VLQILIITGEFCSVAAFRTLWDVYTTYDCVKLSLAVFEKVYVVTYKKVLLSVQLMSKVDAQ